jgi:hypothetical protein
MNTVKKKRGFHRNFFGDFDYESKQFCGLYCCCEQMAARANSTFDETDMGRCAVFSSDRFPPN